MFQLNESVMKRSMLFLCLLIMILVGCGKKAEEQVQIVLIDGIRHIKNPVTPLKGTVVLEVEKITEINPYEQEEVGLKSLNSVRDEDGEVILFDINNSEAERFANDGEYLGSLFQKGQGPGEFTDMSLLYVRFMNGEIWVTGRQKLAKFDKEGQFIEEFHIGDTIAHFVNKNQYVTDKRTRQDQDLFKQIVLKNIKEKHEISDGPIFMEGKNLGMIRNPSGSGGFGEQWGTPNIVYAVDRKREKIYVAKNTEHKIHVKDLDGNTLYIIENPHARVKIGLKEKEDLLEWLLKDGRNKWALKAYPDELVAFTDMRVLPKGYLAVSRVSGLKKIEIDIFDNEGRFIYILEPPENISLERADFYDFGFTTVEERDDMPVYVEYMIKNLPEIFKDN